MSSWRLPLLNTGEPMAVNSMVSRSRFSSRKNPCGLPPEKSGRAIMLYPVPSQKPGRFCSGPRFSADARCDGTARYVARPSTAGTTPGVPGWAVAWVSVIVLPLRASPSNR